MDPTFNNNFNRGNIERFPGRSINVSQLEEKLNLPNFLNPVMSNVELEGFEVYTRDPNSILKSRVFGVPLYAVALFGVILWIIKK